MKMHMIDIQLLQLYMKSALIFVVQIYLTKMQSNQPVDDHTYKPFGLTMRDKIDHRLNQTKFKIITLN